MVVLHEPAHEMRPRVVLDNPPQEQLRRLTLQMPNAKRTAYGSVDVFTSVDSRSSRNLVSSGLGVKPPSASFSCALYPSG